MVARDIVLPVDPDTAWEALTDDDLRREWLGEAAERETVVEESEPGERLVFWWWEGEEPGSRVEVVLTPVVGGTRVSVTESVTGPFACSCSGFAGALGVRFANAPLLFSGFVGALGARFANAPAAA
jgi:uncharacterized protein YndB with AHSA1/START domain